MRIYISGPITDNPDWRKHFSLAHKKLMKDGWKFIEDPLIISTKVEAYYKRMYQREPTYDEYLAEDLRHLEDCTHIYMLKGWKKSKGCNIEHKFAEEHHIVILGAAE